MLTNSIERLIAVSAVEERQISGPMCYCWEATDRYKDSRQARNVWEMCVYVWLRFPKMSTPLNRKNYIKKIKKQNYDNVLKSFFSVSNSYESYIVPASVMPYKSIIPQKKSSSLQACCIPSALFKKRNLF